MILRSPVKQNFVFILYMMQLIFGLESEGAKDKIIPIQRPRMAERSKWPWKLRPCLQLETAWVSLIVDKGKSTSMSAIRVFFLRTSNGALKTSFWNPWAYESVQVSLEHQSIMLEGLRKHRIVIVVFVLKMQMFVAGAFYRQSAPCTLDLVNFWTKVFISWHSSALFQKSPTGQTVSLK